MKNDSLLPPIVSRVNPFRKDFFRRLMWFLKRRYHEKFLFKVADSETVFTSIWKNDYWGSGESLSGPGSTLEQTRNIRKELPILLEKYGVKKLLDAPCGDFNWMNEVVNTSHLDYIGGDIVKGIVEKNISKWKKENVNFQVLDITKDTFPKADLWLCRDVLFHLSNKDILNALKQFAKSDIPYLLTTTYKNDSKLFKNIDISTGDFRKIDLFEPPFHFPKNEVLFRFDDYIDPQPPRELCLFAREQIQQIVHLFEIELNNAKAKN